MRSANTMATTNDEEYDDFCRHFYHCLFEIIVSHFERFTNLLRDTKNYQPYAFE